MWNRYLFILWLTLFICCAGPPAASQAEPDARSILSAWSRLWATEFEKVESVRLEESIVQSIEGPREQNEVHIVSTVEVSREGADRNIMSAKLNGESIVLPRLAMIQHRMSRAYGRAFSWIQNPPPGAVRLAGLIQPGGRASPSLIDSVPVWQITGNVGGGDNRIERVTFWITRTDNPKLLRTRIIGRIVNGSAVITTDYERTGGLDLPRISRAEVVIRQQRRRLWFTTLLTGTIEYRSPVLTRR